MKKCNNELNRAMQEMILCSFLPEDIPPDFRSLPQRRPVGAAAILRASMSPVRPTLVPRGFRDAGHQKGTFVNVGFDVRQICLCPHADTSFHQPLLLMTDITDE